MAEAGAVASLRDEEYFEQCRERVMRSRESLAAALQDLGFEVLPSAANFVFTRHPRCAAQSLFSALRQRDILVRHFDQPRIDDYLRFSVGSDQQCRQLIDALQEIVPG